MGWRLCEMKYMRSPLKTHHPLYASWRTMMARCYRKTSNSYHQYGMRGIRVIKRWHIFKNFRRDVGDRPEGCTLDRINNDGPYSPRSRKCEARRTTRRHPRFRERKLKCHCGCTEWRIDLFRQDGRERKRYTCNCSAYHHPHRKGGGFCDPQKRERMLI